MCVYAPCVSVYDVYGCMMCAWACVCGYDACVCVYDVHMCVRMCVGFVREYVCVCVRVCYEWNKDGGRGGLLFVVLEIS